MLDIKQIRKEFPALRNQIYVNCAAAGPFYEELLEWRQERDLDLFLKASDDFIAGRKVIGSARLELAAFFNCKLHQVSLVPSFSYGMGMVVPGLQEGQNILLIKEDYPSLLWPFEKANHQLHFIELATNLEERIKTAIKEEGITVVAVSLVQWLNGFMLKPSFFVELKELYPEVLLLVDGTQFCGAYPLDFEASKIDVLLASGYKWMLGGYGNGFILFSNEAEKWLKTTNFGFGSVEGDFDKKGEVSFNKFFEPGHLDSLAFGTLGFSTRWLNSLGKDNIANQNKVLSSYAFEQFNTLGLLEAQVLNRSEHSTIFSISGDETLFKELLSKGVVCSMRGGRIRFSFHFFNTLEDITEIINLLKKVM